MRRRLLRCTASDVFLIYNEALNAYYYFIKIIMAMYIKCENVIISMKVVKAAAKCMAPGKKLLKEKYNSNVYSEHHHIPGLRLSFNVMAAATSVN